MTQGKFLSVDQLSYAIADVFIGYNEPTSFICLCTQMCDRHVKVCMLAFQVVRANQCFDESQTKANHRGWQREWENSGLSSFKQNTKNIGFFFWRGI